MQSEVKQNIGILLLKYMFVCLNVESNAEKNSSIFFNWLKQRQRRSAENRIQRAVLFSFWDGCWRVQERCILKVTGWLLKIIRLRAAWGGFGFFFGVWRMLCLFLRAFFSCLRQFHILFPNIVPFSLNPPPPLFHSFRTSFFFLIRRLFLFLLLKRERDRKCTVKIWQHKILVFKNFYRKNTYLIKN